MTYERNTRKVGFEETVAFVRYFLRKYPRRTLLMVVLLTLSGLAEGVGILTLLPVLELATSAGETAQRSAVSQALVDGIGTLGIEPRLEVLLSLIVIGLGLKGGFRWLAMRHVGYTVSRVATDLRLEMLESLLRTRWAYFVSMRMGRFANAIGSESGRSANAYRSLCGLFASLVNIGVYTAVALMISWKVAVFAVGAGVLVIAVLGRMIRLSREAGRMQTRLMKQLTARLVDALQGIKPIKAMAMEPHLQPLLEAETRAVNYAQERQVFASETVASSQEPIIAFLLALGLYYVLAVEQQSFASVLVMVFIFYRLSGRTSMLTNSLTSIVNGENAFWSLREAIEAAEAQEEPTAREESAPPLTGGIELRDVSFAYGERQILTNVSLTVPAGQIVALVGPSGSGKTTIADLVVGLYQPQQGSVYIDGTPLDQIDLRAWRSQIGYVPQEMFLFHDTLFHNVSFGDPAITREEVQQALDAAGAWEFVQQLPEGIDTVLGERGSRLSGGQRQRIAIARALVRNPKLLVFDEATTALDPRTETAIMRTLAGLRHRMTVLAISHQPAITRTADLVYRIADGQVVEEKRPMDAVAVTG